ncbi:hypothetical protein DACRYDRAFT_101324 [Dacryopinax primogenitus]|uniref:Csf1 N-terminal domain-containing protein n=1 Tax=Dacryopinax primogenitus (strain DJM 731) TaxID=1858805 RepID=M5G7J0_DACPD|nr:uncharacterized protein DACRYDRAFT_101324 [Dacryopinax primogenitus]EJT99737.1 hypothetical protein DACRYDRAFT_101324 [Dacryopinax primogenitus]
MSLFTIPHLQQREVTLSDLDQTPLNWLLLVIAVVIVLCVLFFLFYWNRLLARFVSLLLRWRYWKSANTWIECESVQVSLLSGRLFLKDVRYYSRNQAIRVLKCHVTWRYWIWRTRDEVDDVLHGEGEKGDDAAPVSGGRNLPCRIFVYMEGVEWFLYNRTPAFDAIVERLAEAARREQEQVRLGGEYPLSPIQTGDKERSSLSVPPAAATHSTSILLHAPTVIQGAFDRSTMFLRFLLRLIPKLVPALGLRDILPIDIRVLTGAITVGNDATPYLLVGSFKSGRGMWGVGPARSRLDVHRQVVDATLTGVKLVSRTNPDWSGEIGQEGLIAYSDALKDPTIGAGPLHTPSSLLPPAFQHIFAPLLKRKRKSPSPPSQATAPIQVWKGLDRFRTEEERTRGEMRHEQEYAKVPGILEARELGIGWYADVPGPVPDTGLQRSGSRRMRDTGPSPAYDRDMDEIGNGDLPPEWGVDISLRDATVTYGPWMDRQRSFLQSVFIPPFWADNRPTHRLRPGDTRLATAMRVFVQLEGTTTLRLPTRETSKDWKYDKVGLAPAEADADERAYGWINITSHGLGSVSYILPAVVGPQGYDTTVEVDLSDVGITSSVNYANFWQSQRVRVGLTIPSPLAWKALRTWMIEVDFSHPKIFFLRDHAFLIQDLIRDWNSTPASEYAVFVPTRYELSLRLREYTLNLYANDFNVVSKPLSAEDNVFVSASGPLLELSLSIDSTRWRPQCSEVPFTIDIPDVSFHMSFPLWNTHGAFATPCTTHFGTSPALAISGSYCWFASTNREFVDRLRLDVRAERTVFKCFGWVIRHCMILRDNYFGQFTNFTTLEEYQQKRVQGRVGDPVEAKYRPGKSNPLDVEVSISVQDGLVLLPQEVHEFTAAVALDIPEFEVSIDVHETHMGLQICVPPVRLLPVDNPEEWLTDRPQINKSECMVLEGLNIACNRLFGPQPRTATYLCLWEMSIGALRGCVPLSFASCLNASMQAISYTFSDVANSPDPSLDVAVSSDVTFLKLVMAPVELLFQCGKSALQVRTLDKLMLDYTDLPRPTYSRTVSLMASFSARALIPSDLLPDIWYETATITAGMRGEFYFAPEGWKEKAEAQTRFVAQQDAMTHRALFVYAPSQEGRAFSSWRQHGMYFLTYPRSLDEAGGAWTNARASYAYAFASSEDSLHGSAEFHSMGGRTPGRAHIGLPTPTATYFDAEDVLERDETSTDESDDEESDTRSGATSDHTGSRASHRRRENWPLGESGLHSILKPFRLERNPNSYISTLTPVEHWGRFPPLLPRSHWSKEQLLQSQAGFDHELANTTMCLDFQDPVDILITPHVTQFIEDLYSTANIAVCSSDREMDVLMLDQLSMSQSTGVKKASSTALSIQVHSVALRTLQLGLVPNERDHHHHSRERRKRQDYYGTMHHVLTICDVSLGDSAFLLAFSLDSAAIQCNTRFGFPRMCLWRSTGNDWAKSAADPASMLSRLSFPVEFSQVLELSTEGIQILGGTNSTGLTANLGLLPCYMNFLDIGAETAIATATELNNALRRAVSIRDHALLRTQSRARFLLWTVLQFAEDRTITTDPPFLNLTTFLVQHGRPGQRRSDNGWRILAHIRHCLRLMPATLRDHLNRSINSEITLSDSQTEVAMHREVLSSLKKWRTWEIDLGSPSVQTLLRALFPAVVQLPEPTKDGRLVDLMLGYNVLHITGQEVRVSLVDAGLPEDTLVFLGPLSSTVMTRIEEYNTPEAKTSQENTEPIADPTQQALHLCFDANMEGIDVHLSPDLMTIFQRMLRLRRMFPRKALTSPASVNPPPSSQFRLSDDLRLIIVDLTTSIKLVNMHAAAQRITFDFIVRRLISASTLRLEGERINSNDAAISSTIASEDIVFRARSPQGPPKASSNHRSMAWLSLAKPSINAGFTSANEGDSPSCRIALAFRRIGLSVPHSALRLYKFVEEWRAEYIPTYHSMIRGILAELETEEDSDIATQDAKPWMDIARLNLYFQAAINTIAINLRVLPSTWFSWEYHDIFLHTRTVKGLEPAFGLSGGLDYGVHLESQTIRLVQANASLNEGLPTSAPLITLELPAFDFSGSYSRSIVQSLAVVGYFSIKLNAQIMDDVLVIPSKFGKDVNDILDVISESRKKRARRERSPTSPTRRESFTKEAFLYSVRLLMEGFEVGIEGPSSTQYIETTKLEGHITNRTLRGLSWNVSITDLTLSLAHTTLTTTSQGGIKGRYRSAYMTINVEASNTPPKGAFGKSEPGTDSIAVVVQKIHAVMQAAAIGELGDLLDYYQGEMLIRSEQRAEEITAIKAQTQRVLQTFESQDRGQTIQAARTWFGTRFLYVAVSRIGVSFPLTLDEIGVPSVNSEGPLPVSPAFLFSIMAVTFMSEPNNTGSAGLRDMSFQFVSRFDQSDDKSFEAGTHMTRNSLRFPDMKVDIRALISTRARRIRLLASMTGFDLDLDPTIAPYVFSLIDVYQQGKERLQRLAQPNRPPQSPLLSKTDPVLLRPKGPAPNGPAPAADVKASFEFKTARVRLFPPSIEGATQTTRAKQIAVIRRTGLGINGLPSFPSETLEAETFILPGLTAWCEYAGAVVQLRENSTEVQPALLLLNAVVHPSRNTLKPSLLPFITELAHNIENRLQRAPVPTSSPSPITPLSLVSKDTPPMVAETLAISTVASMQINLSLRIDQSTLEMTCQPHVNVAASVTWESGGFLITISPGAKEYSFSASIAGISCRLRHGYLSENCLEISAQDLAASATFKPILTADGINANVVSVVVNTQAAGSVRFARLQDLLCFKAVWLDSIPIIEASRGSERQGSDEQNAVVAPHSPPLIMCLLMQIRGLQLEADLGQSITRLNLGVDTITFRSKLAADTSELSLQVGTMVLKADRTLSGYANIQGVSFDTVFRQKAFAANHRELRMLDLRIRLEEMEIGLSTDSKKILQFHSSPIDVQVYDDWSLMLENPALFSSNQEVKLNFSVRAETFEAVGTVLTLPRLIALFNRLQALLATQREGAARESEAFRALRSSRVDNPLSDVATAMLASARPKFKEDTCSRAVMILQNMQLEAGRIRLAVFPRSTSDQDMVRFEAKTVSAELSRNALEDGRYHRKLNMHLSSFAIQRLQPRSLTTEEFTAITAIRWFALLKSASEATIFNGPPTRVYMESWEDPKDMRLDYEYDMTYSSLFDKSAEGTVFLALNYALFKWLDNLAQSFQEEMDKVLLKGSGEVTDLPISPASTFRIDETAPVTPVVLGVASSPIAQSRTPTPPGSAPMPSTADLTGPSTKPRRMTYHKITPGNIELPQLTQLGDFTPRSNQLTLVGLRLDAIPKWVHEGATLSLEVMMKALLQLYSQQLRRIRSENPLSPPQSHDHSN